MSLSSARSAFANAADDFQFAQPEFFQQVAMLVESVNDGLRAATDADMAQRSLSSALGSLRRLQGELTSLPRWRVLLDPEIAVVLLPLLLFAYVVGMQHALQLMRARKAQIRVD